LVEPVLAGELQREMSLAITVVPRDVGLAMEMAGVLEEPLGQQVGVRGQPARWIRPRVGGCAKNHRPLDGVGIQRRNGPPPSPRAATAEGDLTEATRARVSAR
jgi:hypothetical protein